MNGFTSRTTGWLALVVGIAGSLAVVTLILFFVGLIRNIHFLSFMGSMNDTINAIAGILSAVFASVLHPTLRKAAPQRSLFLLVGVWTGAIAVTYGSWLIVTGRSDVERSSYFFFFGNGLIGVWLWVLNRIARKQDAWPSNLTRWGSIASIFMLFGLLGLIGILLGSDGSDYSALILITGFSSLGIGILYPIWCIRLARRILSGQDTRVVASQGKTL